VLGGSEAVHVFSEITPVYCGGDSSLLLIGDVDAYVITVMLQILFSPLDVFGDFHSQVGNLNIITHDFLP
jgi:hypothetical protein